MSGYVYCCNCGDGPLNTAVDIGCPECQHVLCDHCIPCSNNSSTPAYERPPNEQDFRWKCCKCHHDMNSCKHDVGCAYCGVWKCEDCEVYINNGRNECNK
ncbi:hypothetical protein BKA66DRAFT_471396 [Pyrenochaeta sp. MPI-SDFR-AT-0127]|nr:hypothetical protein BKA66DRAFT_471396 [Pyrenochaeta sp. MPI-SDFR-AT-0127]